MWHLVALGATGAQAPWWEPPLHALLAQLNEKFLNQASADEHADKLLELTLEDTQLGRMSSPLPYMPRGREGATDIDMEAFSVSPRFSIVQGACAMRGGIGPPLALQPVLARHAAGWNTEATIFHNFTAFLGNGWTRPAEKLRCDTLDLLYLLFNAWLSSSMCAFLCRQCLCTAGGVWAASQPRHVDSRP